jgi:hypothetical protein
MKRRHTLHDFSAVNYTELSRKTAIHEAGHAAAIHFGNRQKQLPPVFFQIIISDCTCQAHDANCLTKVEGGRLIHTLPSSLAEATRNFLPEQKHAYQQAFEADIINLLVGSLAEANYVAQRDNELITPHLIPVHALYNYGGAADLETIKDYLQCVTPDKTQQQQKVAELLWAAFEFINDWAHWYAITALADYLLGNDEDIVGYEEITTVLDTHFSIAKESAGHRPQMSLSMAGNIGVL